MSSLEVWPVMYCVNILMYINHHLTTFRGCEKEVKATLRLQEDYLHG